MDAMRKPSILAGSIALNLSLICLAAWWVERRGGLMYVAQAFRARLSARENGASRGNVYITRTSIFEALPHGNHDVVFLGDSITHFIEWSELFDSPSMKNRGIEGDTVSAIAQRIEEVVKGKPARIFLMCGINDLQGRVPLESTIKDYRLLVSSLIARSPNSQLYVLNVLPVNQEKYQRHILSEHPGTHMPSKNEVGRLNTVIDSICQEGRAVKRLPLTALLTESGELNGRFTYDGLHLNGEGMLALRAVILPYLGESGSATDTIRSRTDSDVEPAAAVQ